MAIRKNTLYNNFQYVDQGKNEAERIARFKEISSKEIKTLLDYAFNPNIKFVLDENIKYNPSKDESNITYFNLLKEIKKLHIFISVGDYANLTKQKKSIIFRSLLENIHPDDAKLMMAVKDKKMPFKNITPELVKKVWPNTFTKNW